MELESQTMNRETWDGYVDWRGKPALMYKHGGMKAAFFVLVVEAMENLAYLANASNLVRYMTDHMHFTPSEAANGVTNFMGTAFLLALVGGFLSDAFFTTYNVYLASAVIEFMGLVILTVQAQSNSLKPPKCDHLSPPCQQVHGPKRAILSVGLYLVALGVGGIKGSLPSHGAEQLDETTSNGRRQRSSFFNYFVFSLSSGALIAVTLVVWIEDSIGWQWGFGVSTLTILLSIPVFLSGSAFYRNKIPVQSPLAIIFKVVMASFLNTRTPRSVTPSNAIANMATSPPSPSPNTPLHDQVPIEKKNIPEQPHDLNFLDRAALNRPRYTFLTCTAEQVEEVKAVLKTLPIFACTIVLNSCLAQLSTFSVQQAATMDTNLGTLKIPPASLPVLPVIFIMILAPLYDHVIIPFARRLTKSENGITNLQRIGLGLVLSVIAMAVAALVEVKRKRVAADFDLVDPKNGPLPVTFFWVGLQYLFLGSADLFTLAGLMEFFFTEAPFGMRTLATSLSFASLVAGYYLSTVVVSVVNGVTGGSGRDPWLSGRNLNYFRLERFYWLMCGLSGLNFLHYLFWAKRYKYRSTSSS